MNIKLQKQVSVIIIVIILFLSFISLTFSTPPPKPTEEESESTKEEEVGQLESEIIAPAELKKMLDARSQDGKYAVYKGNLYKFKDKDEWEKTSAEKESGVYQHIDGGYFFTSEFLVNKEGDISSKYTGGTVRTIINGIEEEIMFVNNKILVVKKINDGEYNLQEIDSITGGPIGDPKPGYGADCKDGSDCATGVCGNAGCSDSRIEKGKTEYWRNINKVIDAMSTGASFGQSLSSLLGLDFSEWEEMISSFFEESVMGKMLGAQEDLICGEPSFNVDPNSAVVVEVNGQVYYGLYITCERSQIAYYYNDTSSSKEYYYMWNYRVMNTNEDLNYYNIMFRGNGVSKNYYNKWQNITAGGTESYIDSSAMVDNSSNYYDEICVKLKYEIEDASGNKRSQVCNKCSEPSYEDVEVPYNTEEESNSSSAAAGSSSKKEEDPKNSNW
jgi:hypothetical protein